jgi:hypothetical protein
MAGELGGFVEALGRAGTSAGLMMTALTVEGVTYVALEELAGTHRVVVRWTGEAEASAELEAAMREHAPAAVEVLVERVPLILVAVSLTREGPYQQALVERDGDELRRSLLRLMPGENLVDAELWAKLAALPATRRRIESGEILVKRGREVVPIQARALLEDGGRGFREWSPRRGPGPSHFEAGAGRVPVVLGGDLEALRWGGELGPVPAEIAVFEPAELPVLVDAALAAGHPDAEGFALEAHRRGRI